MQSEAAEAFFKEPAKGKENRTNYPIISFKLHCSAAEWMEKQKRKAFKQTKKSGCRTEENTARQQQENSRKSA